MTPKKIQALIDRWDQIDSLLADISDAKVVNGNPAQLERELLEEVAEIEYLLGVQYCRTDRGEEPYG